MTNGQLLLLADIILMAHGAVALFITVSLPVIWIGHFLGWRFVRNPWFRFSHLGLMGFVLLEALVGVLCPLTMVETTLRRLAGQADPGYTQGFIVHWVDRLLFHDLEPWIFTAAYAAFFAAVVATLCLVPVHGHREKSS